jgi:predicted transposase YbfD/YdcC
LLNILDIRGCTVTIDAMGCQTEIAQAIIDAEADYVLSVKKNQGRLYEDIQDLFVGAAEVAYRDVPHDYTRTVDKDHGRLEIRECWTIADKPILGLFANGRCLDQPHHRGLGQTRTSSE